MVKRLDANMRHLADVIRRDVGIDTADNRGAGAAGGMGEGAVAFLDARLESGIDCVLNTADFDSALDHARYVITGEGKFERQSLFGKAVSGVAARAKRKGVPVIAVVGDIGEEVPDAHAAGVTAVISINRRPVPFSEARLSSAKNLASTMDNLMRIMRIRDRAGA